MFYGLYLAPKFEKMKAKNSSGLASRPNIIKTPADPELGQIRF